MTAVVRSTLAALVALLAVAVPAAARSTSSTSSGIIVALAPGGGKVVGETLVPYTATGALTVTFQGEPAAGCSVDGDCVYSGTESWSAAPGGQIDVIRIRDHGRTRDSVSGFDFGNQNGTTETAAVVARALTGGGVARCSDTGSPVDGISSIVTNHGDVADFQPLQAGSSLMSTRCAGPTDAELAPFSPRAALSIGALQRGERTVNLSESRSVTTGGYGGTLSSTIVLHLGTPHRQSLSPGPLPPGSKPVRMRLTSESLTITAVTGTLRANVTGVANPEVCALLDSCGSAGTLMITPHAVNGSGELAVTDRTAVPLALDRAALGLGPRPASGGLPAEGGITWRDTGMAPTTFGQAGSPCTGTGTISNGFLTLAAHGDQLDSQYRAGGPLRDECPGPILAQDILATATVPRSLLGHRTFTLHLRAAGPISDQGYDIQLSGALSVRVRRGPVRTQTFTEPSFSGTP